MQRVLDLDLDFFIHGVGSMVRFDGPRLDADEYPPWEMADVMAYLEERCRLLAALPGHAVEHHSEVFTLWRQGLLAGDLMAPFHVTHIDAHADLGMGENGYWHLLTEQLHLPPAERWYPRVSRDGLERAMTDGSYLAFAVGCRWISDLTICPGGGDIQPYIMEGWNPRSGTIRMPRLNDTELRALMDACAKPTFPEDRLEPPVPLALISRDDFFAPEPFDFIFWRAHRPSRLLRPTRSTTRSVSTSSTKRRSRRQPSKSRAVPRPTRTHRQRQTHRRRSRIFRVVEVGEAFELLKVPRSASREDIEKAHREAMKQAHPDHNPGSDGQPATRLNQARDVALGNIPGTDLVLVERAALALAHAQQRATSAANASDRAMKQVVMHHIGLLSMRKRRNAVVGAISGVFGVVVGAIGAVLGPEGANTGTTSIALLIAGGVLILGGIGLGIVAVGSSTQEKFLEVELEDVNNTLSDRGDFAQMLDELFLEQFFTRDALRAAIQRWSEAVGDSVASPLPRPGVLLGGAGYRPVPLSVTARRIGPVDFARLILTKGVELGLLEGAEQPTEDGRVEHGYRRGDAVGS